MKLDWQGFLIGIVIFLFVIIIIFLYVIVCKMSTKRGRNVFGWFLFSIIFSPILAMIFLLLLGETEDKRRERMIEDEEFRNRLIAESNNKMKKCFKCAELIQLDAKICRYCGYEKTAKEMSCTKSNTFTEWKKNNPSGTLNEFYREVNQCK